MDSGKVQPARQFGLLGGGRLGAGVEFLHTQTELDDGSLQCLNAAERLRHIRLEQAKGFRESFGSGFLPVGA